MSSNDGLHVLQTVDGKSVRARLLAPACDNNPPVGGLVMQLETLDQVAARTVKAKLEEVVDYQCGAIAEDLHALLLQTGGL